MSSQDRPVATDVDALRDENARLHAQLHRIVRDLEGRTDVAVRVDLDAAPGEASIHLTPLAPRPLDALGVAEVHEVAERLALIQRDLHRIAQQVDRLLWRVGEPAPPLTAVD